MCSMAEIMFRDYRDYVDNRVQVNNAMMALLAGLVLVMKTYWLALFTGRASAPKTTDI